MASVLVTGGAGYIGSHMVLMLAEAGHRVVTLDNLSAGHRHHVLAGEFVSGDLGNRDCLQSLLVKDRFDAVMHFGGSALVGESMGNPGLYYRNNVVNGIQLLESLASAGVKRLIFSSSCSIFGEHRTGSISESDPKEPINPYGRSKLVMEQVLADYDRAYGLKSVSLRYFNAAGADPLARIGEKHDPETHLIPLVLQTALGRRAAITIQGTDYPTPDGTCLRDYVHVVDLCSAHKLALDRLLSGGPSAAYNLGSAQGFSVRQVIRTAEEVTGRKITVLEGPRRPGDPGRLISDSSLARRELNWTPLYPELRTMIEHAWAWEMKQA